MVGDREKPFMKIYVSESNAFLHFTGMLLQRYGVALGEARLAAAQRCQASLAELHHLFRKHPLRMPLRDADALCKASNSVIRLFRDLHIHQVPKLHMLLHFAFMSYHSGSPSLWGCWFDESCNQDLKRVCKAAHALVWHERVLANCGAVLYRFAWGSGRGKKRGGFAMELEPMA